MELAHPSSGNGSIQTYGNADTGVISTYGLFIFIGAISVTLFLFAPFLPALSGQSSAYFNDLRVVLIYGAAFFYLGRV